MSFSSKFFHLPTELVNIICLYTGKFLLDKNKRLHSIVNLYDFENIKLHIDKYLKIAYHYNMNRERLVRILYTQKKDRMYEKERIREELSLAQFANPKRHPLLFLKESPVEEVIVPLEKGIFCETCENKLTSTELIEGKRYKARQFTMINLYAFYYRYMNINPYIVEQKKCKHCSKPIVETKDKCVYQPQYKKQEIISSKQNIHVQKLYNNRRAENKYNHMRYYKYSK